MKGKNTNVPAMFLLLLMLAGCMTETAPMPNDPLDNVGSKLDEAAWKKVQAATNEKTVEQLLQQIRSEIPQHWTVSYEKETSWMEVVRSEPVTLFRYVINGDTSQKPELGEFSFAFRVVPYMKRSDYNRLKAENIRNQREMSTLYETLVKKHVSHKFDSFIVSGDDPNGKLVERYNQLNESLHNLPDYYYQDLTLKSEWSEWLTGPPYNQVVDDAARQECAQVMDKVIGLLSKYEGAAHKTP
jgi:hypothetical protein